MTVSVDIDLGYEFAVKASFKDVFAVLADVLGLLGQGQKARLLREQAIVRLLGGGGPVVDPAGG